MEITGLNLYGTPWAKHSKGYSWEQTLRNKLEKDNYMLNKLYIIYYE